MSQPQAPHPRLTADALAAIYTHARAEYPYESCGLVSGPRGNEVADTVLTCVNVQNQLHAADPKAHPRDASTAYQLEPKVLIAMEKGLRGPTPTKIIYHSHVNVGAYFSATDQAVAQFDGEPAFPVEYVVVDVQANGCRGAKQFAWDAGSKSYVEIGSYGPL